MQNGVCELLQMVTFDLPQQAAHAVLHDKDSFSLSSACACARVCAHTQQVDSRTTDWSVRVCVE